jgi:hypothetical protein
VYTGRNWNRVPVWQFRDDVTAARSMLESVALQFDNWEPLGMPDDDCHPVATLRVSAGSKSYYVWALTVAQPLRSMSTGPVADRCGPFGPQMAALT